MPLLVQLLRAVKDSSDEPAKAPKKEVEEVKHEDIVEEIQKDDDFNFM